MKLENEKDLLLLDGDCGLCHRLARFINKRTNGNKELLFKTIESQEGKAIISTFPKNQQNADTVYLVRKQKSYIRSAAGIRALLYMKWYWRIWFPICWLVPLPLRDLIYLIIAKNRHRVFKPLDSCDLLGR